jgi:hypothetical protein
MEHSQIQQLPTIDGVLMKNRQYSIYEVIEFVRHKPGMYLGYSTPHMLLVFLDAYRMAMDHAGIEDVSEPPYMGFFDWVAEKFGFSESTAGWANMILAITLGLNPKQLDWETYDQHASTEQQAKALQTCFECFDEYRQQ